MHCCEWLIASDGPNNSPRAPQRLYQRQLGLQQRPHLVPDHHLLWSPNKRDYTYWRSRLSGNIVYLTPIISQHFF